MIDLASIFYSLGIVFFVTCFVLLVVAVAVIHGLYTKATKLRDQLPMKVVSYFRDNNATQLKALGVAIVGFVLAFLRGRMSKKKV
jgi:hypothetical protein